MSADPTALIASSIAAVRWLEQLRYEIYEAQRQDKPIELISLFGRYKAFDPVFSRVHQDVKKEYEVLVADLNLKRDDLLLPVYGREFSVVQTELPRSVYVFTDGSTLSNRLAPTHVVVEEQIVGGRRVIGVMDFDPTRPDELTMEFDLSLQVDPWLRALTGERLGELGESAEGMFTRWRLEARELQELGINDADVTLGPSGRNLRVRLTLDGAKASLILWKLFSEAGLPIGFDWTLPDRQEVRGDWTGVALSLARRSPHGLVVDGSQLVNSGDREATVEYVMTADGCFEAFPRALTLSPGEAVQLHLDRCGSTDGAEIPATAVTMPIDPLDFQSDFFLLNGDEYVEDITVSNLLPAFDEDRGGALEYVEATITVTRIGGGDAVESGPYRLSAAYTEGSEVELPFLRLGQEPRVVILEGVAYYANGGCQTITKTEFDTFAVKITSSMLPSLDRDADAQGPEGNCSD